MAAGTMGTLAAEVRKDPWRYLGPQKELRGFLGRLAWLKEQWPEGDYPEIGDAEVVDAAVSLCAGMTRLSDLADARILDILIHGALRKHQPADTYRPLGRTVGTWRRRRFPGQPSLRLCHGVGTGGGRGVFLGLASDHDKQIC